MMKTRVVLCLLWTLITNGLLFSRKGTLPSRIDSRLLSQKKPVTITYRVDPTDLPAVEREIHKLVTRPSKPKFFIDPVEVELDVDLSKYPASARHAIANTLKSLKLAREAGNEVKFVDLLKTLATKTPHNQDDPLATKLMGWLETMMDQITDRHLSMWIWSLAKLGMNVNEKEHKMMITFLVHRFCHSKGLNGRDITMALGGIFRAGMSWTTIPQGSQKSLLEIIVSGTSLYNAREISNNIYSIQKMGIPWSEFSAEQRSRIWDSIMKHANVFKEQEASMVIYSLGLLEEDYDMLTQEQIEAVHSMIKRAMKGEEEGLNMRNTCQQNSNSLLGLTKMHFRYESLPEDVVHHIEHTLLNSVHSMNEQEISNTIYSLGTINFLWKDMNPELQKVLQHYSVKIFPNFIRQGVSTLIYGLACMGVDWKEIEPDFKAAFQIQVVRCFHSPNLRSQLRITQATANTIYALGKLKVPWVELSIECRRALLHAVSSCCNDFNVQEAGNIMYGLGGMGARLADLSSLIVQSFVQTLSRLGKDITQQELCSILHGLANMDANWQTMPDELKRVLFYVVGLMEGLGTICLACTTYSFGKYGLHWKELPKTISSIIEKEIINTDLLVGQSVSNTFYGLGLMNAAWDQLGEETQAALYRHLSNPAVFSDFKPQHISNSLWGLAKIEAVWSSLPTKNIEESLGRVVMGFSSQELSNALYGLGGTEATWNGLQQSTVLKLMDAFEEKIMLMNTQELANSMYSLTMISFDCDFSVMRKKDSALTTQESEYKARIHALIKIHHLMLNRFTMLSSDTYTRENYDQFSIYFEVMKIEPVLHDIVIKYLPGIPKISGPSGLTPSRTHSNIANALEDYLFSMNPLFNIYNEYSGLAGVFPIDIAVFYGDELIAFVEVDGKFHYRSDGSLLQRKDQLKEILYARKYPTVPFYRIRDDQIRALGPRKAGEALGVWVTRDLKEGKGKLPTDKWRAPSTNFSSIKGNLPLPLAEPVDLEVATQRAIEKIVSSKVGDKTKKPSVSKLKSREIQEESISEESDAGVKKRRGRPKKAAVEGEKKEGKGEAIAPSSSVSSVKKGRGRPRKNSEQEQVSQIVADVRSREEGRAEAAPKKRGRPKKQPATSSA